MKPYGALALILALGVLVGCRGAPEPREEVMAARTDTVRALVAELDTRPARRPAGSVVVQLAFSPDADLDLFVTAPDQETVYFANTPTRLGGSLEGDVRCGGEGTAVERVDFPNARSGRYRVGIDFPRRCDGHDTPAVYAIRVEHDGGTREAVGVIRPGEFLLRALEADIGTASSDLR